MSEKPAISLSLDLDNKWAYLRVHGEPAWESRPTYIPAFAPRILEFLRKRGLTITFFIVGQDTEREENTEHLAALAEAGHEIASHSHGHEPWMGTAEVSEIVSELKQAKQAIERVTGQTPVGFRGPGFAISRRLLETLAREGYQYDASMFPTYLGPLARAYYFATAKLSDAEKRERSELFGKLSAGRWPLKGFRWDFGAGRQLIEIPVTTLPLFKVPIHLSYIIYIASFSPAAARAYARSSMWLCRRAGVEPSLLLHPLDFLGPDDAPELSFFPGMRMSLEQKLRVVDSVFDGIQSNFQPLTMLDHSRRIGQSSGLKTFSPVQLLK